MQEHHRRILVAPEEIQNNKFLIEDIKRIHRIKNVLRLKVGDKIFLTDGGGNLYHAVITNLTNKALEGYVIEKSFMPRKNDIIVYQAVIKYAVMDELIRQLSQLSIAKFVPIYTTRSQKNVCRERYSRWVRISKQQGHLTCQTMNVEPPIDFCKAVSQVTDGLLLDINSESSLKEVLREGKYTTSVNLFIGPEGDFTEVEKGLAREHGIKCVNLSSYKHIFTSYLATICTAIIVLHELGAL